MLVVPLVPIFMPIMNVSAIPVAAVTTILAPPASAGDHKAEEQRADSNDLHVNGRRHLTLNDQLGFTRNGMTMIGAWIPITNPSTPVTRAFSRATGGSRCALHLRARLGP